ncbi:hypothetical protein AYL99_01987 [Fonsecaea erecta]|uniref:HNH nuclease domain-containing protein n=1 Tax=Fonsecaea erecta TaxID=1367422 RepID=A0A178ZSF7_9EURO|nr:hypothetical protein AYL99_01987 [Fonsecaea erecta]OAP62760.1 hypothetical protein AYL99_01987 [Fonsecaea erecta]
MLPPPVPSSAETTWSGSSRKRKRSDVESAISSSTSSASQFTRRTKKRIAERNGGEQCWHCGARAPDIAPVVGRKDGSFGDYVASGLLTFDHLGDEQNGLPLCPSCHRAFDDLNNPGLIFIPIDLDYFIDFELKDYQSRIDIAQRHGDIPPRMVPTPQMYSEYLKRQNLLSSEAVGGLYWRYTLRDFFPVNADRSFIPGLGPFKEPGVWCGAPTAALRRVFHIFGNPTTEGIPEPQLEQLWQLRKLYARKVTSTELHESAGTVRSAEQIDEMKNDSQTPSNTPVTTSSIHPVSRVSPRACEPRNHDRISKTTQARRKSATLRAPSSIQLLKYGRGASTESNIQRYVTMIMSSKATGQNEACEV